MTRILSLAARLPGYERFRHWPLVPVVGGVLLFVISVVYGALVAQQEGILLFALVIPMALVAVWFVWQLPELAAVCLMGFRYGYIFDALDGALKLQSPALPLAAFLMLWVFVKRFREGRPVVSDTILGVLFAYLLWVGAGVWYALYPELVATRFTEFSEDILVSLAIMNLVTDRKHFMWMAWLLMGVGALLGTLTVYQEITQTYDNNYLQMAKIRIAFIVEGEDDRARASGPLGDPNFYGQQLVVLVPLAFWGVVSAKSLWARMFAIFASLAIIAGIGLSYSRGAQVAMAMSLLLFMLQMRLAPRYYLMLIPLVIGLYIVAPADMKARFNTLSILVPAGDEGTDISEDNSFQGRSFYLKVGQTMFSDSPIVGLGADHFKARYTEYVREFGVAIERDQNRNAHNYYLEVTTEHGIIGIGLVITIMVLIIRRYGQARKAFLAVKDKAMADLAGAMRIAFYGYMFSAIFLHGDFPRFFWLQVATAIAIGVIARRATAEAKATAGNPGSPSPAAALPTP